MAGGVDVSMDTASLSREDLIAELEKVRDERDQLDARVSVVERQLQMLKRAITGKEDNFYELDEFGPDDNLLSRLRAVERSGSDIEDEAPPLVYYARMPEDAREEHLSTSEQIAVELHINWADIAWQLGDDSAGRIGVDTKTRANAKHRPSRLRYRLKQLLGRDLDNQEIYRGLKRLASLSGGDEDTDKHGRLHIVGGEYIYQHRPVADASSMKHVLFRRPS